jgi:hypothetical protein
VQGLLRWMEICRKVRRAIHPSSYPTCTFKELHDTLQVLKKKYVVHLFGQPAHLSTHLPQQRLSCTVKLTCKRDCLKLKNRMEYSPNLRPLH